MSQSGSGKPDPVLEGVALLFQKESGSASFGPKVVLSLNGVDPSYMKSITGSNCRTKCSNILHDITFERKGQEPVHRVRDIKMLNSGNISPHSRILD
jgi:hypothetical protein